MHLKAAPFRQTAGRLTVDHKDSGSLQVLSGTVMTPDETDVELQPAPGQADPVQADPPPVQDPPATDADATEADVSEADLDQEEQEKQPMTGGAERAAEAPSAGEEAEKNGAVKLKIPDEEPEEAKFTGLNKEELLRVAGTPGWVRTRWALLVVFWLGWLGMLGGAVLIILQAPRCRDLPHTHWWNQGPLYRIGDVRAFSDAQNLKGVEQKLGRLSELKVKGLIVGPIHVAPPDDAVALRFEEISANAGNLEQFQSLLRAAHKKGMAVVLDLTPNYRGTSGPWFSSISVTNVAERLKSALVFWMNQGIDGVQLSGVQRVSSVVPSLWTDIRAIVQNGTEEHPENRLLLGVSDLSSPEDVSSLLSSSGVDLLVSGVLSSSVDATERAQSVQRLYSEHSQQRLSWSLGGRTEGHMASLGGPDLVRVHQLLLLTLPGTPVFNYGDEIGLMDEGTKFPRMLWDSDKEELNGTLQEERAERLSCRSFFRSVSELRSKERSLQFGDFLLLSNSSSSLVYLRIWDQSKRFLVAFNFSPDESASLQLSGASLPRRADVVLATNSSFLPTDARVDLQDLRLGPRQAAILSFPYSG